MLNPVTIFFTPFLFWVSLVEGMHVTNLRESAKPKEVPVAARLKPTKGWIRHAEGYRYKCA
jgi:hypothetical protein